MATSNLLSTNSPFLKLLLFITLYLAASLIPFIGLLFLMTLPTVLFVACFLNDQTKTLNAFLTGLCILFFILFFMQAMLPLFTLATIGLAGILMAWTARRNSSIEPLILLPAGVILGAVAGYFVFKGMQLSAGPIQVIEKYIAEAVDLNIKLYGRLPLKPDELKAIADSKPEIVQLFVRIFPALCIIAILFTVWINALLSGRILRKNGMDLPGLTGLCEWKAPGWLVWVLIAAGALSLVPNPNVRFPGINILLSAVFIYLLQGLAIVSFFFQNRDVSTFFRWLFYFLIAIQQMLMIAIAAVGFFDIWIDFRKYFRKDQATH